MQGKKALLELIELGKQVNGILHLMELLWRRIIPGHAVQSISSSGREWELGGASIPEEIFCWSSAQMALLAPDSSTGAGLGSGLRDQGWAQGWAQGGAQGTVSTGMWNIPHLPSCVCK